MTTLYSSQVLTVQELIETPFKYLDKFWKRLQSELKNFRNPPEEILSFSVVDETKNLEHWEAKIRGPMDTPYENGIFVLNIHLTRIPNQEGRLYPFAPPKIKFITKLFHPNVSSKGEICLDLLHHNWCPALTLSKTLLSICSLLSDPNIDDFLVPEAAYLYKENREEYNRKAREWTRKYAMGLNDLAEAQKNINELKLSNLDGTVASVSISSSLLDQVSQQAATDTQSDEKRRPARFNVAEPLQAKTFDNGESKEYVPIVAECLCSKNDQQERYRHQMYDFHDTTEDLDINNELQLLATALEKEGVELGKRKEAEILIDELCTLKGLTPDKVGQGCLHLYSMHTFLYPQLNQFLREADRTKIGTYGSFVRLLCFYFNHPSSIEVHSIEVYRGMNLSKSTIEAYEEATKSSTSFRWAGFSSTSKCREFAESFSANTLFIMQLKKIYSREKKAIDISGCSQFPREEEILLKPGVEFTVEQVYYNEEQKKYYIYLSVYV